jgi:uncharacterized membrane protein
MPEIGVFHPQIVHIVIVGAGLGILFRWVSLTGKLTWTSPAATTLILIGAVTAWFAVTSGDQTHQLSERIPGVVRAVQTHEDAGHDTRNVLLGLGLIEIVALLKWVKKYQRWVYIASGVVGVAAAYNIYESGRLGGELVYSYAGGVGMKSGDTTDVNRLLIAGLYNRAQLSRSEKNAEAAAQGFAELAAKFQNDPTIKLLAVESMLIDAKNPAAALAALAKIPVPADTERTYTRYHLDKANAFVGLSQKDSARAILTALAVKFPQSQRIKTELEKLK